MDMTNQAKHLRSSLLALTLVALASPFALGGCSEAEAADPDEELAQRLDELESKEDIRGFLADFAQIVDSANLAGLTAAEPRIAAGFTMEVVDFDGQVYFFEGYEGLIADYGPIMVAAQANLSMSAVDVDLDGDSATAHFTFLNSVQPPPQLDQDVSQKLMLLADNTATFTRTDGRWQLESLELVHSLAYPGELPGA